MTILAIDYGTKRTGVAVSDASETLAFPKEVIENRGHVNLIESIKALCEQEKARLIVLGHSRDSKGNDNPVMDGIRAFKTELEAAVPLPVIFQEESWSSAEASRYQGNIVNLDASAAAIILQRFLDTLRAQA